MRKIDTLWVLGGFAVLGALLALWSANKEVEARRVGRAQGVLISDAEQILNRADGLRIITVDGTTTLRFENGGVRVAERDDLPADTAAVRRLADSLLRMEKVAAKTARPERLHVLGLADPIDDADPEDAGLRVEIFGENASVLAAVIVGDAARGGALIADAANARYARRADEQRAWLVDHAPDPPRLPGAWLAFEDVATSRDRLQALEAAMSDGRAYRLTQIAVEDAAAPDFELSGDVDGESSAYVRTGPVDALAGLAPEDALAPPDDFELQARVTVTPVEGAPAQLRIGAASGDGVIVVDVAGDVFPARFEGRALVVPDFVRRRLAEPSFLMDPDGEPADAP